MDRLTYGNICRFLQHGILPDPLNTTKGNFIRQCSSFQVNGMGILMRGYLIVAREENMDAIFEELHRNLKLLSYAGTYKFTCD